VITSAPAAASSSAFQRAPSDVPTTSTLRPGKLVEQRQVGERRDRSRRFLGLTIAHAASRVRTRRPSAADVQARIPGVVAFPPPAAGPLRLARTDRAGAGLAADREETLRVEPFTGTPEQLAFGGTLGAAAVEERRELHEPALLVPAQQSTAERCPD
jgi:hypothetical protein